MLEASGIVPSKTQSYDYPTIFNAVKSVIGTDPTVTCVYDHVSIIISSSIQISILLRYWLHFCMFTSSCN